VNAYNDFILQVIQVIYSVCPDVAKETITEQMDAILSNEPVDNSTQTLHYGDYSQ
jgi:hypothetical protein